MNIDELILGIQVEREQAIKRRDRAAETVKAILAKARQDGRANLTEDEDADVKAEFARREQAVKELSGIEAKLRHAEQAKAAEDETDRSLAERAGGIPESRRPAYDRVARIGQEERTYHKGNCRNGGPFLRDVVHQYLYRDLEAEQRLTQHMKEERVERGMYLTRAAGDANTGAFTGLVVPQYLTDMYAPAIANLRPFADICNKHDLPPDGMTVNISRITTAASVALQSTELSAVSATSLDDTLLTENVQTAAGQQTLSRQAIDRGTGIEDVTMGDLFNRYATNLDSTLINQSSTGLSAVATGVTYDDTTPTVPELYPKLFQTLSAVEVAMLAMGAPTHVVMHSRRWYWLNSYLSSTWPLINQPGTPPQVAGENAGKAYNSGVRGILPNGLGVVVDNNVSIVLGTATSQDEIYVVPQQECHLWEDPSAPVFLRAEQAAAASLGVLLVLYGYFAYSFRRYSNGMGKIAGTGLATPSWT